MIHKIHGEFLLQELFSYIFSKKKKLKLIKNNLYLIKMSNLKIDDFKLYFFQKKIKEYEFYYINDYYIQFCNDFTSMIENKEELRTIFLNSLSKNNNFDLNILDDDFDYIFKNKYFKNNIRINMNEINNIKDLFKNNIPKILLIKNNKLTDKAIKTFKEIFNLFSTNGKMNKIQGTEFVNSMMNMNIQINENNKYVNNFFQNMILIMKD